MAYQYLIVAAANLVAILLALAVLSCRVKITLVSPVTAALATMTSVFVVRPFVLCFMPKLGRPFLSNLPVHSVMLGMWYFLGGLALWTAVVLVMVWREQRELPPDPPHDGLTLDIMASGLRIAGLAGWAMLFIYYVVVPGKLASFYLYFSRAEAPGLIIKPATALFVTSCSLVAYRLAMKRAHMLGFWAVQLIASLAAFGLGGRTTALICIVAPLLTYVCTRYDGIKWSWLFKVVAIVLLVAGAAWFWRTNKTASSVGDYFSLILISLSNTTGCSYDYYLGIVDVCSREPDKLRLGQTYAFVIMRLIKGFHRLTTDTDAPGPGVRALVGEAPEGGVPATALGEGFWNFGFPGLLLVALMHGLMVGICEKALRIPDLPIRPLWVVYLSYAQRPFATRWFQQAIANGGLAVAFLLVVGAFVELKVRRRLPAPASTPPPRFATEEAAP
jgi:hypothetical protein